VRPGSLTEEGEHGRLGRLRGGLCGSGDGAGPGLGGCHHGGSGGGGGGGGGGGSGGGHGRHLVNIARIGGECLCGRSVHPLSSPKHRKEHHCEQIASVGVKKRRK